VTKSAFLTPCGNSEPKTSSENQETQPEPIESTVRVLNLTEGLRVIGASIRLSADSDTNKQRTAASGPSILRMLACLLWDDSDG
jgi:hypothetical protein